LIISLYTAGVDSGTYSVDIVVVQDNPLQVVYEEAIPRVRVVEEPEIVVERLLSLDKQFGLASIVMSSGYGIPLKQAREASDYEIWAATFIHDDDEKRGLRIIGLRRVMELLKRSRLNAWFTPGVVQLDSVPLWRKLNKIDMGTSDKVYSVAAALWDQVENHDKRPEQVNMIVLEVGYAYTAAIAVDKGRIVDGIGGTSGFTGYMGAGAWDAELAYLAAWVQPKFTKNRLFEGGAAALLKEAETPPAPSEVAKRAEAGEEEARMVIEALAEAAAKDALALLAVVEPSTLYVTGRWARIPLFMDVLKTKLKPLERLGVTIARIGGLAEAKEAAFGAALIANGLAGGEYKWIVSSLGLRESKGTVFDNIAISIPRPTIKKAS